MKSNTEQPNTTNMRKSGKWMVRADERILEHLVEAKSTSPSKLAGLESTQVSKQHFSRRLSELAEHGLVENLGNGIHQLTTAGWYYLAGEYDASTGEYLGDTKPDEQVRPRGYPILWPDNEE